MYEFSNRPPRVITPMFLIGGWHYKKFIQWLYCFILQHGTSLLQQMKYCGKLHNSFLSCIPIPKLGSNILSTMRSKQLMIFSMFAILGIIQLPLLHISSNVFLIFLPTYVLTKRIPLTNKDFILSFHLNANLTLDNEATI